MIGAHSNHAAEEPKCATFSCTLATVRLLRMQGAGAPMLGDLKETNFNDPSKPDLIFGARTDHPERSTFGLMHSPPV